MGRPGAAEVAAELERRGYPVRWSGGYFATTTALCHGGNSGEQVLVRDGADGRLQVKCLTRECRDVRRKVLAAAGLTRERSMVRAYQPEMPGGPKQRLLNAVYRAGVTPQDLLAAPVWFVAIGKGRPLTTANRHGEKISWRFSIDDGDAPDGDGVRLARGGGWYEKHKVMLEPHRPFEATALIAARARESGRNEEATASMSMVGSKSMPFDFPLAVIDVDYKPEGDGDGIGAECRDRIEKNALAAGLPVYRSRSGNGRHILAALREDEMVSFPDGGDKKMQLSPERAGNCKVDIFLPGCRHHVAWCQTRGDWPVDRKIPEVSRETLVGIALR